MQQIIVTITDCVNELKCRVKQTWYGLPQWVQCVAVIFAAGVSASLGKALFDDPATACWKFNSPPTADSSRCAPRRVGDLAKLSDSIPSDCLRWEITSAKREAETSSE